MDTINLSIVIVSWNVKDLLVSCLKSILKHKNRLSLEIIVIDNGSKDGTVSMLKKDFADDVEIIPNTHNIGFGAANNQGILRSRGEYILILNPDTEIVRDALQKMLDFMATNHKIGIAGCRHLNSDWTLQPSVRRFPTIVPITLIATKIAKVFPQLPPLQSYLARDFNYKLSQDVDQVAGSFMVMRKCLLDEIGLFDENFFIWFEEVDLCKRAHLGGWQVWYNSSAEIIHHGGQSFKQQLAVRKQGLFFQSAWYYFQKHGFFNSR